MKGRLKPSPAPPSVVRGAIRDMQRLLKALDEDYPPAYRAGYESGSGAEVWTSGQQTADDGSVPGSTASIAADKEQMRNGLSEAATKLQTALGLIRSASGLVGRRMATVDVGGDSTKQATNWTEHELAEAEQRARTKPSRRFERTA